MASFDRSTEHGISSGFRFYTGDSADGDCICRAGARLHLGHLGDTRHLPRLAEWAGHIVRCDLGYAARQYCTHGVGLLSAVRALGRLPLSSGISPVFTTGGNPVTSERK